MNPFFNILIRFRFLYCTCGSGLLCMPCRLQAKNRLEIDRITRDKEEEMAEVHKRVKQALVKKEEIVAQIRSKYEAAEKRADHLESLLESIRKQNSGAKSK